MLPGKFLGIAWNRGDSLCYFIRTFPNDKKTRSQMLVRSVAQKASEVESKPSSEPTNNHVVLKLDKSLPPTMAPREETHQNYSQDSDETSASAATTAASTDV